ncbi:hypothetical protein HDK77DRAFT_279197 [Phyllosticta capitalensis]|uniref:Uncharacterized protein n=1 Tax=Phyllosticta capitalensis TaxID=121624 RepID=A0ABR1YGQ6_9PEZI
MDLEAQRKELDPSLKHGFKVLMQLWRDFTNAGHFQDAQLIFNLLGDYFAEGSMSKSMAKSNGIRSLSKTLSQKYSHHRAVLHLTGPERETLDLQYQPSTNHEPGLFLPERFLHKVECFPNRSDYLRGIGLSGPNNKKDDARPHNASESSITAKRPRESDDQSSRTKRPKIGNHTEEAKVVVEAHVTIGGRTIASRQLKRLTMEETLEDLNLFADWKNGKGCDVSVSFEAFRNFTWHFQ